MMYRLALVFLVITGCGSDTEKAKSPEKGSDIHNMSYGYDDTIRTKAIEDIGDYPDGPVKITYPNGVTKAEGQLIDGKKNSLWKSYYENGVMWSSTYFYQGLPDGHTISYYKNGKVMFKGTYEKGKRVGEWSFYNEEGDLVRTENF